MLDLFLYIHMSCGFTGIEVIHFLYLFKKIRCSPLSECYNRSGKVINSFKLHLTYLCFSLSQKQTFPIAFFYCFMLDLLSVIHSKICVSLLSDPILDSRSLYVCCLHQIPYFYVSSSIIDIPRAFYNCIYFQLLVYHPVHEQL